MDLNNVKNLIDSGEVEKAKEALDVCLAGISVSPEDRAQAYAEAGLLYVRMNTAILKNYIELQSAVIKDLQDLRIKKQILTK